VLLALAAKVDDPLSRKEGPVANRSGGSRAADELRTGAESGEIVVATNISLVNPIVVRQKQEVKCLSAL
jgi:hypothetical protein